MKTLAHRHDRVHDRHGFWIPLHFGHKGAIDFDSVKGELPEIGQARITCAKIIQRDRNSKLPELCKLLEYGVRVFEPQTFSSFKVQPLRIKSGCIQSCFDDGDDVALTELNRR